MLLVLQVRRDLCAIPYLKLFEVPKGSLRASVSCIFCESDRTLAFWRLAGYMEGTSYGRRPSCILFPHFSPVDFPKSSWQIFLSHIRIFPDRTHIVPLYMCDAPGTSGGLIVSVFPAQTVWGIYAGNISIAPLDETDCCS